MTIAVDIVNLSVQFRDRVVIKNLTLALPSEGITVLIGRSGSGKSTFLRTLNRLNESMPDSKTLGAVRLRLGGDLIPIYAPDIDLSLLRRRVGMLFQTPNVLPASIRQNMLLPLQLTTDLRAAEREERMRESLENVGLWEIVKKRLEEAATVLSGGQQQRLCLARMLALEPEIILLDEPTASLDPATTLEIEKLLHRLAERYTLVMVSHGLSQAKRLGSRVVLFGDNHTYSMLKPEDLPEEHELNFLFEGKTPAR